MDEELKERLVTYLDVLEEGARKGSEFVAEQAPETVRQWITFNIAESVITLVVCVVGLALVAFCYRFVWMRAANWYDKNSFMYGTDLGGTRLASGIIAGGIGLLLSIGAYDAALKLLQCWLAPNVFILKEISQLVK